MSGSSPSALPETADLEWCHEAVQGVSRTFALTIDVLDEPMSSYICVGYLLCRVADTVEDANHIPPAEQAAVLRTYDALLDPEDPTDVERFMERVGPWIPGSGPEERSADWNVVAETPRVLRTFERQPPAVEEAIRPPVRELVSGMAEFVERYAEEGGLRIQTREELEEYCYYAAGTVGKLITNLVCRGDVEERTERRLYARAESFGLLLQLVNIAKDVHDDIREENNVYLPADWLEREGVAQEAVCAEENVDRSATVVRRTANHARTFLDDAQRYLQTVPEDDGNRLAAWAIPYLLAVGTLRELSDRPEDALSETGVKVSRQEVQAIVARMLGEGDRESLPELRRTIDCQPFHQASPSP
jgi:farnesyl-diphosphate farnesyltransferase